MTPSELLRKAAAIIREHGLAKGDYADGQGRRCVLGACNEAQFGHPHYYLPETKEDAKLRREALNAVHEVTGAFWIPGWNDADSVTADDVAVALEGAAAKVAS